MDPVPGIGHLASRSARREKVLSAHLRDETCAYACVCAYARIGVQSLLADQVKKILGTGARDGAGGIFQDHTNAPGGSEPVLLP
jgi:hypothetical protein